MEILSNPIRWIGVGVILLLLFYTLLLLRFSKIDAQHAMSWLLAELGTIFLLVFDPILIFVIRLIGENNIIYTVLLFGFVWIVSIMLDLLVRLSSISGKVKAINQELALLKEQFEKAKQGADVFLDENK
jgi:hypothetical protein